MEPRARRAMAAMALALAAMVAIGAIYLRPWQATTPAQTPAPRLADGPESVLRAQFLSASVGWVVTGGTVYAAVFHTTDSGRHWQRQLDAATGSNGWGLWFFDARRGVAYGADLHGPAMWRTADGGQRWTRLETSRQTAPGLVFFLDPGHGWCVTGVARTLLPNLPGVDRQEVALLRTTDGGVHWSTVLTTTAQQPVVNGLGDDGQKSWIVFRDARVGWIGQSTQGAGAVVYGTTDGQAWRRAVRPGPEAANTRPMVAGSSRRRRAGADAAGVVPGVAAGSRHRRLPGDRAEPGSAAPDPSGMAAGGADARVGRPTTRHPGGARP